MTTEEDLTAKRLIEMGLGRMPDTEFSEITGLSTYEIRRLRASHNMPAPVPKSQVVYEALRRGVYVEDLVSEHGYRDVASMLDSIKHWAIRRGYDVRFGTFIKYKERRFSRGIRAYVLRCRFRLSWAAIEQRLNFPSAMVAARTVAEKKGWLWPPPLTEKPRYVLPESKKLRKSKTPRRPDHEVERLVRAALAAAPRHRTGRHRRLVGDVGGPISNS